jgi:hypothetical protein
VDEGSMAAAVLALAREAMTPPIMAMPMVPVEVRHDL